MSATKERSGSELVAHVLTTGQSPSDAELDAAATRDAKCLKCGGSVEEFFVFQLCDPCLDALGKP